MQKLNFQLFSIKSMVFQSILCEGGNVRKNSRFEGKREGEDISHYLRWNTQDFYYPKIEICKINYSENIFQIKIKQ